MSSVQNDLMACPGPFLSSTRLLPFLQPRELNFTLTQLVFEGVPHPSLASIFRGGRVAIMTRSTTSAYPMPHVQLAQPAEKVRGGLAPLRSSLMLGAK